LSGVVFLDVETTGLMPMIHDVWELAIVEENEPTFRCIFPVDLSVADPGALEVGKFHERHPHQGYRYSSDVDDARADVNDVARSPEEVEELWTKIARRLDRKTIVGFGVNFDVEFMRYAMLDNGVIPTWDYKIIELRSLVLGWVTFSESKFISDKGITQWSSAKLCELLGVDRSEFALHTALGDAQLAHEVWKWLGL